MSILYFHPPCDIDPLPTSSGLAGMTCISAAMDWGRLQIFMTVARSGSLVKAGALVRMDPTTIGRKIRILEHELSQTLFEKTREGQVLTTEGHRLFTATEAMESAAIAFERENMGASANEGLVRVSVAEGFGTWFVADRLQEFSALWPKISVDLVANSGFLNPSRKEADVAVLLARPRRGPLRTRKLTDYSLGIYVRTDLLESVETLPLVSYIPELIYAPELAYLEEMGLDTEPRLRSSSINAQSRMIASGAGYGVLPCFLGDRLSDVTRFRRDQTIQRTFWLAVHEDVSGLPRIRAFIDWLVHTAQKNGKLFVGDES